MKTPRPNLPLLNRDLPLVLANVYDLGLYRQYALSEFKGVPHDNQAAREFMTELVLKNVITASEFIQHFPQMYPIDKP